MTNRKETDIADDPTLKKVGIHFIANDIKWQENHCGEEGRCKVQFAINAVRDSSGISYLEFELKTITGLIIGWQIVNWQKENYKVIAPIDFTKHIYIKEIFVDPIERTIEIIL